MAGDMQGMVDKFRRVLRESRSGSEPEFQDIFSAPASHTRAPVPITSSRAFADPYGFGGAPHPPPADTSSKKWIFACVALVAGVIVVVMVMAFIRARQLNAEKAAATGVGGLGAPSMCDRPLLPQPIPGAVPAAPLTAWSPDMYKGAVGSTDGPGIQVGNALGAPDAGGGAAPGPASKVPADVANDDMFTVDHSAL